MKKLPRFSLLAGNAATLLAKGKPNYFSAVVTSPPYNIGKDYGNDYKDDLPMDQYLSMLEATFLEIWRVMKPDGLFFLNIKKDRKSVV